MGTWFTFRCPSCDYETTCSGGPDVGMAIATQTILCRTCKVIGDVVTERFDRETGPAGKSDAMPTPKCPADESHEVVAWSAGGPCPKCGTALEETEEPVLWD